MPIVAVLEPGFALRRFRAGPFDCAQGRLLAPRPRRFIPYSEWVLRLPESRICLQRGPKGPLYPVCTALEVSGE
jgi:hypothetical protein